MIERHPSDNLLLEYSAGRLPWALSISVAAHLHFCPQCRHKVNQYNVIGGSLLNNSPTAEVSSSSFEQLLGKIKSQPCEKKTTSLPDKDEKIEQLPPVIQKLIPKDKPLKWAYASPVLRAAQLETGQSEYEVSFHKIKRGGKVPEHDHRGLEVTIVLEGSFSDERGNYSPGDFIVNHPGDVHRPTAAQDQDCLCLSVVEAPVKLTGVLGYLLNPFLSISPR